MEFLALRLFGGKMERRSHGILLDETDRMQTPYLTLYLRGREDERELVPAKITYKQIKRLLFKTFMGHSYISF